MLVTGVISGPPQWLSRRHSSQAASDSPLPRPPAVARSTSSQSPPSLPPKQPRPLSHHSALQSDPVDQHASTPPSSTAKFSSMTSYPAPPTQAVATIPRRSISATTTSSTPSGPRGSVPTPTRPPRDAGSSEVKTESEDNSSNECSVCLERPPDCVLYMCGHMCVCYTCAVGICQSADASCPICRRPIDDIIKIFRS